MTRLFRVHENGDYTEVDTTERLAGIYDALLIAERTGDGRYVYDHQTGQYQEFSIAGSKAQEFTQDSVKYGTPGADLDRAALGQHDEVSAVGGVIFPSDGVVGTRVDESQPAVEEF
jgi:hypothetical protein